MFEVWFAVRYLDLISAAVLLGGAILLASDAPTPSSAGSRVQLAVAYERTFWSSFRSARYAPVMSRGGGARVPSRRCAPRAS